MNIHKALRNLSLIEFHVEFVDDNGNQDRACIYAKNTIEASRNVKKLNHAKKLISISAI